MKAFEDKERLFKTNYSDKFSFDAFKESRNVFKSELFSFDKFSGFINNEKSTDSKQIKIVSMSQLNDSLDNEKDKILFSLFMSYLIERKEVKFEPIEGSFVFSERPNISILENYFKRNYKHVAKISDILES
jgi:hypothetical protein